MAAARRRRYPSTSLAPRPTRPVVRETPRRTAPRRARRSRPRGTRTDCRPDSQPGRSVIGYGASAGVERPATGAVSMRWALFAISQKARPGSGLSAPLAATASGAISSVAAGLGLIAVGTPAKRVVGTELRLVREQRLEGCRDRQAEIERHRNHAITLARVRLGLREARDVGTHDAWVSRRIARGIGERAPERAHPHPVLHAAPARRLRRAARRRAMRAGPASPRRPSWPRCHSRRRPCAGSRAPRSRSVSLRAARRRSASAGR